MRSDADALVRRYERLVRDSFRWGRGGLSEAASLLHLRVMALASFRTDNASKLEELYGELKSGVWELSFPNGDVRCIDDERLACKLSAFSPPDEWGLENNTKEDKETRTKKLLEILESKKVLLIFVDSAGKVDELSMNVVSRRIRELKANLVPEILVTTALDKVENQVAKGRVIEVEHKKNQITGQESLSSCCERIGKTINRTPGLQSKLLLENILMDFCCYKNKFPFKRGSAHYRELITYWILEGFLGPFDCFENAYEKGHRVIMALAHHGFIENQQAGYVRKNVKMLDLSSCCCCRIEETVRLGLANVFEGDLGRIAHADGVVRTLGKAEKGKKSTLLIDRNFLNLEVPFDLFQSMREIEALAIFNPTSKPEPLSLDMQNLRLLVLRGCNFLGGIENLLDLRSTVSDKTSFQKLSVLEISGPSPSLTIPDNLFEYMPQIRSLNLSSLQVASLPSSLYQLTELVRLILRDCSSLKEIRSIKSMTKLQVLDLSGSTSLGKFFDKNFEINKELQMLNLSKTKIKWFPLINGLGKLTYLLLRDCKSLSRLHMISSVSSLRILDLSGATNFVEFHDQSLGKLGSLEETNVSQTQIEKLPLDICNVGRLSLRGCSKFKDFPHLKNPDRLQFLDLSATNLKCTNLKIFPSLDSLTNLEELNLSGLKCQGEVDVDFFKNMVTHFPSLSNLEKLKHLSPRGCQHLPNLEGVTTLEVLDLSGSPIVDLPSFENFHNLRSLLLRDCSNIKDFKDLEISEVLKGSIEKLPYGISKLTCLNRLELPKMKDEENEDDNGTCHPKELLHCPWRISSWPLEEVSSSRMPDIFVDSFQVLQLLKNNSTIGKSFNFLVHPIEEENDI
ncbi:hypothetical protein CQW23_34130 [Capsicum baccatum]|uniref:NB-ARC domain-containing protein n=1 Tax=Capsicum baccatum TaxID=33114 RepID=A0A2G2UZW0_CAPBA|nr:hypothetical protein CQW23_34130 [Capsicum baccatum]